MDPDCVTSIAYCPKSVVNLRASKEAVIEIVYHGNRMTYRSVAGTEDTAVDDTVRRENVTRLEVGHSFRASCVWSDREMAAYSSERD